MRTLFIVFGFLCTGACAKSTNENSAPAPVAQAHTLHEGCANMTTPSGKTLEYCLHDADATSQARGVIYFFHGLGGSAEDLFSDVFVNTENSIPALGGYYLVSVSYGSAAILTSASAGDVAPKPAELVNAIFPQLEAKLDTTFGKGVTSHRVYLGLSLGGFNAIEVAATDKSSNHVLTLLCPAVIDFNPFDPAQIAAYRTRNAPVLDNDRLNMALGLLQQTFGTFANWTQADPMQLLINGSLDGKKIFISTGQQDQYGFFDGATSFNSHASAQKVDVTWVPVQGGHCAFDPVGLARFLGGNL